MTMKKVFNSLFVIIVAMITFAGCAKQEIDAPATPEAKTVQFFANSFETKTEFGTPENGVYPTLWSAGDEVKILVNLEQIKNTEKTVEVECSDDFKSARFESELAQPEADDFTFYSISPASALRGKSSQKLYVTIPAEQAPLPTSVDKKAQLLYAASETTEAMPSSVELTYHHLTAYGRLSLTNLTSDVTSVSSVTLKAPADVYLAGGWDYFVADGSFVVRSGNGSNTITISTENTTDIWFACAPVDMSNKTLTLTVTTDKGDLVKEIAFPANRKFEAGRIAKFTVNMEGIGFAGTDEPEQPGETAEAWTLVTDVAELTVGDKVVIAAAEENYALGKTQNNNNRASAAITKSGDVITINDDVQVITLQSGTKASTFAFHTEAGYLYAASSSSNYLKTQATLNDNGSWSIEVAETGVATIKAQGTNSRNWLRFNTSNSPKIFSCYGSGQTDVAIYRLEGGSEGGETPEEPEPDPTPDPEPEGPQAITVADFLNLTVGTTEYQLTGVMEGTYNTTYGNFYLNDGTGKIVVYGLTATKQSSNDKSFASLGLKDGDTITIIGTRDEYNGTAQVGGPAYLVSSEKTAAWDAPTFSFMNNIVTIVSNEDATIYYTLDGTTPSESSLKYSEPFEIQETVTVSAVAVKEGRPNSTVATKECEYVEISDDEVVGGSADFATIYATNTSYVSGKTTAGWNYMNCAVLKGGNTDSNPAFKMIGDASNRALCMNGKTSAVGSITSPTLTTGCGTLTFNYGLPFSDTKIKFRVDIKQNGSVVKTFTIDNTSATKNTKYSHSEEVNVSGDFQIVFTNLSPSNSTSNKDRTAVWDIEWTGYKN